MRLLLTVWGGAPGGEEAAEIAINTARTLGPNIEKIETIFSISAELIKKRSKVEPDHARMGTTLSVAIIKNDHIYVAHVGDTRIYHLRGRGLKNLTEDQTEVAELLRKGVLSQNQARRYPRRNIILSALTKEQDYVVYRTQAKLENGDRILFSSDGVHQCVKRGAIVNASRENPLVNGFVQSIERRVNEAGPSDNYTALAIEIFDL